MSQLSEPNAKSYLIRQHKSLQLLRGEVVGGCNVIGDTQHFRSVSFSQQIGDALERMRSLAHVTPGDALPRILRVV